LELEGQIEALKGEVETLRGAAGAGVGVGSNSVLRPGADEGTAEPSPLRVGGSPRRCDNCATLEAQLSRLQEEWASGSSRRGAPQLDCAEEEEEDLSEVARELAQELAAMKMSHSKQMKQVWMMETKCPSRSHSRPKQKDLRR
jgi:hypothetical protein